MRAFALVVALVAVNGFASIDVPSPSVRQLARQRVLEACGGHSAEGCTQFREAAMLCECLEAPDGWRVDASVRAVPSVYVERLSWVKHEMTHIADFRHFLKAHVGAMESRRFKTVTACENYTRAVLSSFAGTMQRIARISADRRDGKALATSEDHLVVVKAEVVPQLVDDRLADLANDLPPAARDSEYRTAKNRDLIGQRGKHVEGSLRQRNTAVDPEELVVAGFFAKHFSVLVRGLFFHDDDDVVEKPRKLVRQLFESLFDELLELRRA